MSRQKHMRGGRGVFVLLRESGRRMSPCGWREGAPEGVIKRLSGRSPRGGDSGSPERGRDSSPSPSAGLPKPPRPTPRMSRSSRLLKFRIGISLANI